MIVVSQLQEYEIVSIPGWVAEHGNIACKLYSDQSPEELHEFAARLGIGLYWFQKSKVGPAFHYYPLDPMQRAEAVRLGAVEMDINKYARRVKNTEWGGFVSPDRFTLPE